MPIATFSTILPVSATEACAWHARSGALNRLLPPWQDVRVIAATPAPGTSTVLADGGRVTLSIPVGPLRLHWEAVHRDYVPGSHFVDVQERGPFAHWEHRHEFAAHAAGCTLTDRIDYEVGWLTALAKGQIARDLPRMFAFRHARTAADLERHAAWAARPRLRIAVAGASGLVGSALVPFLNTAGHTVSTFSRRGGVGQIAWDPTRGEIDAKALDGIDAVVHLGGANVAQRWNEATKREILTSRVASTRLLAETLAKSPHPPRTLVVASATGLYGFHNDDVARSEDAPAGDGFLADICQQWEAASEPARQAGIRVVMPRIGLVMSARGGALAKMLTPFRCGVGGPIGGGRQWQSWIQLDDLLDVIHQAIMDERMSGPVNAVAPHAVRQAEFARVLGHVLHRPAIVPLPSFAVSLLFGEMGRTLLLGGVRVAPQKLTDLGFCFRFSDLEAALRFELGR